MSVYQLSLSSSLSAWCELSRLLPDRENLALVASKLENRDFKGMHFRVFSASGGGGLQLESSLLDGNSQKPSTPLGYHPSAEFSLPAELLSSLGDGQTYMNFVVLANDHLFPAERQLSSTESINSQVE